MQLNAFIDELEARAAMIPYVVFPADEYDFCAHCGKPLSKGRTEYRRVHTEDYCQLCYEIRDLVSGRKHFLEAQREYNEQKNRLNQLRPGSNYFSS